MLVYSLLMFAIGLLFIGLGLSIRRGNTKLIHDYHQKNVKAAERQAYGRAIAKRMFAICATLLASGVVALFGEGGAVLTISLLILFAGQAVSIGMLVKTQKKYNGGVFS